MKNIHIFNITISNGKNMADGDNKLSFQKINSQHDLIVYALIVIALALIANHLPTLLKEIFIFLKSIFVKG